MTGIFKDIRYAARTLLRSPANPANDAVAATPSEASGPGPE